MTNDFVDRLPAASAAKLHRFRLEKADAHAAVQSLSGELRELIADKQRAEARLRELLHPPGRASLTSEDHPDVIAQRRAITGLTAEIERTKEALAMREVRLHDTRALVAALDKFLSVLPPDAVIAAFDGAIPKSSGIPVEALANIRSKVSDLKARLHETRSAPRPSSEAKALMRQVVEGLASQGAPNVNALLDGVASVEWPVTVKTVLVAGFTEQGHGTAAIESFNFPAVFAWALRDQLIARLDEEISACADDGQALTQETRAKAEARIVADLLMAERQEESLIEIIGPHCARRRDTDPRAVLNLASDLPGPNN